MREGITTGKTPEERAYVEMLQDKKKRTWWQRNESGDFEEQI